jgi:hypothetical protein
MDQHFQQQAWRTMARFVNNLIMFLDAYHDYIDDLDEVFSIFKNLGLTLKVQKIFLGFHSLELLSYLVD